MCVSSSISIVLNVPTIVPAAWSLDLLDERTGTLEVAAGADELAIELPPHRIVTVEFALEVAP